MSVSNKNDLLKLDKDSLINYKRGKTTYTFLPDGSVFEIISGSIMINQFYSNACCQSPARLLLRLYENNKIIHCQNLTDSTVSEFGRGNFGLVWQGEFFGAAYKVTLMPHSESIWLTKVEIDSKKYTYDVVYGIDIGLANKGGVLSNELFTSQYLDRVVHTSENGYVITCRQNQPQNGKFPYMSTGMVEGKAIHYSTDAMQFFAPQYKQTNIAAACCHDLPDVNYQYELSYSALQSEKLVGKNSLTFFNYFNADHPEEIKSLEFWREITDSFRECDFNAGAVILKKRSTAMLDFNKTLTGQKLSDEELNSYFPEQFFREEQNGTLLSFFVPDTHEHVALPAKEAQLERSQGHIITSGFELDELPQNLITSTNYMIGVFSAQTVVGNTSMNKLNSVFRGLLNIDKTSGQRIFVKIGEDFHLLTMPSVYIMGLNYSKWLYKIEGDVLTITSYAVFDEAKIITSISSKNNINYEFIITNRINLGSNEYDNPISYVKNDENFVFAAADGASRDIYPDLKYYMSFDGAKIKAIDNADCGFGYDTTLFAVISEKTSNLAVTVFGTLTDEPYLPVASDLEIEHKKYLDFYKTVLNDFSLVFDKENERISKINEISYWYAHNALVHFAVPHGLEQNGGAAWGTRDICQGPIEFFLSGGHFGLVRKILLKVFANQLDSLKEWPQWFMFDKYPYNAGDCHGDVVFWPLKTICDYILRTNDYSILNESVSFKNNDLSEAYNKTVTEHIKIATETIFERFIGETGLITYAGGDWDDTLQPINNDFKKDLVSTWTVTLAYQVFSLMRDVFFKCDTGFSKYCGECAERIKASFEKHLINDGVIAGFGYIKNGEVQPLLHPKDNMTGINYRLLPMTRSIIAELVTKEQAAVNYKTIDQKLKCPDGVRLMDKPAQYTGGVSKIFVRAEQAANVGREISLCYIHAHIRYIEAMAKYGKPADCWEALAVINPINIQSEVKTAALRQSNAYFSSSEGAYNDRYEFARDFDKLRKGEIEVKAGWRIYSSGPGIFLNQLFTAVLGFRPEESGVIFDPVLPCSLSGMQMIRQYQKYDLNIKYSFSRQVEDTEFCAVKQILFNGKPVKGDRIDNPYRTGGLRIYNGELAANLIESNINYIEIILD